MIIVSTLYLLKSTKCCNRLFANIVHNHHHFLIQNGKISTRPRKIIKSLREIFLVRSSPRKKCSEGKEKLVFGALLFGSTFSRPQFNNKESSITPDVKIVVKCKTKRTEFDVKYLVRLMYVCYEYLRIFLRAMRLTLTFTPIFILYPVSYFGSGPEDLWWNVFVKALELSGPICVKFGQWASTRRDLFSAVCCSHLSRLQRRTKPHSWNHTKVKLAKAFGKNWNKIFVKFDNHSEPVGSGCVAQVYKVWMREDAIEDKVILEEITFDQEDDDEFSQLYLSDGGLEVLGFGDFLHSRNEEVEEEVAINLNRVIENGVEERETASSSIRKLSENLAQQLLKVPPVVVSEDLDPAAASSTLNIPDEVEQCLDDGNAEQHALVEQWQQDRGTVEKDLPAQSDEPKDVKGLVPVAIKVLHPGVYTLFRRDMAFFRCGAQFFNILPPLKWISLPECVAEFSKIMCAQIDLRIEANNLEEFSEHFVDVNYVKFPKPLRPYVSRSVLVETYEEGEPMLNFITEEKSEAAKKNLAKYGVDMLLKMIFQDNFVHGDLHPGNILVQNVSSDDKGGGASSTDGNQPKMMMVDVGSDIFVMDVLPDPKPMRICILDCGIVAALKPQDLTNLTAVFTQIVLGNGQSVADLFLNNSDNDCKNPKKFREDMMDLVDVARENAVSLGQVDVGILLQQVLCLLMQHQIKLEAAMSSVVLAVFILEGLGRSLDPHMDILERARPLLVTGL